MASIRTNVPDIGIATSCDNPSLFPSVQNIQLTSNSLTASLSDGLEDEAYERYSKEIRVMYAFCFEQVYSEDYDIILTTTHIGHSGHNERKEYLLSESAPVSEGFGNTAKTLFEDIMGVRLGQAKRRGFFNSAFIWARANELQELQLLTEAYTQYWRLLDLINEKSQLTQADTATLLEKRNLAKTESNRFAVRVLHKMGMLKEDSNGNIESLSLLDSLRHPHAHQASGRTDYYMEEETHLEAEMHNIFIADITKLFIIHEIGLQDYYLKPRANIYELAKR